MPQLPDETVASLARELAALLDRHVPGWTSDHTHDPGIVLLDLMAYLADVLVYRETSADAAKRATDVIVKLHALTAECEARTIERVRYFDGQLLTTSDLTDEQHYHRDKLKRALLALHGTGIVKGLEVEVEGQRTDNDIELRIDVGVAITPAGELLVIEPCRRCRLQSQDAAGFVALIYTERETRPVPVPGDATSLQATRVEESVSVPFGPNPSPDGVTIARLIRSADGWQVDRSFVPQRT